jgi:hypothetical protein
LDHTAREIKTVEILMRRLVTGLRKYKNKISNYFLRRLKSNPPILSTAIVAGSGTTCGLTVLEPFESRSSEVSDFAKSELVIGFKLGGDPMSPSKVKLLVLNVPSDLLTSRIKINTAAIQSIRFTSSLLLAKSQFSL